MTQTESTEARFEATGLNASLTVADVQRSASWYRDVLGFEIAREYQRDGALFAVAVRAGVVELLLGQDNGARGGDRVKGEGFSLRLTTTQDIDAYASGITSRGGVLETEPADTFGMRAFRIVDPDGFRLVFSSQPQ